MRSGGGVVLGDVSLSGTQPFSEPNSFSKFLVSSQARFKPYYKKPNHLLSLPSQVPAHSQSSG